MCKRAYWEFRRLFNTIVSRLAEYSPEWGELANEVDVFGPKCKALGYCPESRGCGAKPPKTEC